MTAAHETPRAIVVLLGEHETCRQQIESAEHALSAARGDGPAAQERAMIAAQQLLRYLETGLETHIAKEEGPLFPRLKASLPAGDRLIDEMIAEHDLIRIKRDDMHTVLLELLSGHDDIRAERASLRAALTNPQRSAQALSHLVAAVASVATKLRVHFENEEELVFPLAPALLRAEDLLAVCEEMTVIEATGAHS